MSKNFTCRTKYIRISPDKLRRVGKLIRNKEVNYANVLLKSIPHKGAEILSKSLKSAISNCTSNTELNSNDLYISELLIDQGPSLKRHRARARGRIFQILKRTSHIKLTVSTIKGDN